MLTPVVCFSCGSPLGSKAPIYREFRAARVAQALSKTGTRPSQASLRAAALQIDMKDILDRLGVDLDCCRMHMATTMDWRDYY